MPTLVLPHIAKSLVGPDDDEMSALAAVARDKLRTNRIPTDEELAALRLDTIAQRPALRMVNGVPEELPPRSLQRLGWDEFVATIGPLTASVGRIDSGAGSLGTGFLVQSRFIATNRHVALGLIEQSTVGPGAVIRFGLEDEAAIDLDTVPIRALAALHDTLDVALVELEDDGRQRTPLVVSTSAPSKEQPVATIGYPFPDGDRNPLFVEDLFAPPMGVQRVAPGDIEDVVNGFVWHDCSTLGGNSGSPVLDRATGEVVGLHFDGSFLTTNKAVAASDLLAFLASTLPPV